MKKRTHPRDAYKISRDAPLCSSTSYFYSYLSRTFTIYLVFWKLFLTYFVKLCPEVNSSCHNRWQWLCWWSISSSLLFLWIELHVLYLCYFLMSLLSILLSFVIVRHHERENKLHSVKCLVNPQWPKTLWFFLTYVSSFGSNMAH